MLLHLRASLINRPVKQQLHGCKLNYRIEFADLFLVIQHVKAVFSPISGWWCLSVACAETISLYLVSTSLCPVDRTEIRMARSILFSTEPPFRWVVPNRNFTLGSTPPQNDNR